jgi:hypothetical protein
MERPCSIEGCENPGEHFLRWLRLAFISTPHYAFDFLCCKVHRNLIALPRLGPIKLKSTSGTVVNGVYVPAQLAIAPHDVIIDAPFIVGDRHIIAK